MKKQAFNKENPVDLFSQLLKVLNKEKDRGNLECLIPDIRNLSNQVFIEWKKPKISHKEKVETLANMILASQELFRE